MDEKVLIERFNVLEQDDRVALVRAVRKLKNQKEKLQRADSYKEVQKLRRGSMSSTLSVTCPYKAILD